MPTPRFMCVAGGYDADPEDCEEGLEGIGTGAVGADQAARGDPRGRRGATMGDDQRAGLKKVRVFRGTLVIHSYT